MNILVVHNRYTNRGGEDLVFENEVALLKDMGHNVVTYERTNEEIDELNFFKRMCLPLTMFFSLRSYFEVKELLLKCKIDVMHVHNTLIMVSPSAYYAAFGLRIPVIQTIHNFRLLCPNGLLMRQGKICEECIAGSVYNAVKHKCYRNSRVQSFLVASMIAVHRRIGTYNKLNYICLSAFNKKKILELNCKSGVLISSEQIFIKPNFYNDGIV